MKYISLILLFKKNLMPTKLIFYRAFSFPSFSMNKTCHVRIVRQEEQLSFSFRCNPLCFPPLCPQSFKGVVIERQSPLNVTGSDCQKKRGTALQNSTSTYTKSEFPSVFMMNNRVVTIFFGAQFATKYISVALYMYFDSLLLYLQT